MLRTGGEICYLRLSSDAICCVMSCLCIVRRESDDCQLCTRFHNKVAHDRQRVVWPGTLISCISPALPALYPPLLPPAILHQRQLEFVTAPMVGVLSIAMIVFVCPSVRTHVSWTSHLNYTTVSVHVACGRGLVVLWRRCNALCTSCCVDDVMLYYNRPDDSVTLLQQPCCSVVHGLTPLLPGESCVLP